MFGLVLVKSGTQEIRRKSKSISRLKYDIVLAELYCETSWKAIYIDLN